MDALFSVSLVLIAMVAAIYRRVNIAVTVFVGVVLTSLLFGRLMVLPSDAVSTLKDYKTLSLMLMIYLVFFLNNFLSAAGVMKKTIGALENLVSDQRVIIALIPSLIGLIPSPSGAVLSAPFADEIGGKADLPKERRLLLNYWFRHVSEYINPIYPGVLLATGILGITYYSLFVSNVPVMAVYVLVGILFYVLAVKKTVSKKRKGNIADAQTVARGVTPILLAVILPVVINVDLTVALACAIACAFVLNRKDWKDLRKIARDSLKIDLIALVFLVLLLKMVLDESHAASLMSSSLIALGAPVVLLIILIPLTVGFLTGLTIGYVGLSFPILLPFIESGGQVNMGYVTLAFVSGYLGVMLSPMHLCLSVTLKYFNAELSKVYRQLILPVALTMAWTIVYVLMLR